ncbi:hypothetical protein QAD02_017959 [Eretmocerus hayati]|uniref:Uncharacterized protein n=1 Tax=Eretmocerus hayati TaxID=131215 RepID=A0ACC2PIC9_9HYME|nr:hypothetical protein QAD02_017959 [Eretmocerus hayati]
MNWSTTWANINKAMNHLLNNIERELSPHKVNVIVPSTDELSPLAKDIVQEVNQNMICNIRDYESLAWVADTNWTDQWFGYPLDQISERLSLTLGVLEVNNETSIQFYLSEMLKNFHLLNPSTRGEYLLNFITNKRMNLKSFLHKAWSEKFLDLTVLEWITADQHEELGINSSYTAISEILVHSYNPFNSSFQEVTLMGLIDLFPDKVGDLHGFPLNIAERSPILNNQDQMLLKSLYNSMNSKGYPQGGLVGNTRMRPNCPISAYDILVPFGLTSEFFDKSSQTYYKYHILQSYVPVSFEAHFYLMRKKSYERRISTAALLTFASLTFTAFIFAVWARLLGFRESNWSFLNIFTAQMGGSIQYTGPMRLSKMIYQMSIYIATSMIVTIGSDYMFQIFTWHQGMVEIKTMADLANSNMDLVMEEYDYASLKYGYSLLIDSDPNLQKVFHSLRIQRMNRGSSTFCRGQINDSDIIDESVNLCFEYEENEDLVLVSDSTVQVDKIQDPIIDELVQIKLGKNPFFKHRLEELILKFSQMGLIKLWWSRDYDENWKARKRFVNLFKTGNSLNKEEPLENQLWPVLGVGYVLGCVVLIGELLWKKLIAKSEIGRLMSSFYRESRAFSVGIPRSVGRR